METLDVILEIMYDWANLLPRPLESKHGWYKRTSRISKSQFERSVRYMQDKGLIEAINKNGQRFIKLTQAGQLEALLSKATRRTEKEKWDGKWRLVMFDIPESSKNKRHFFRALLKTNGFYKLQASVYINPYPLNREALSYLKQTGLINYIRIVRIDEMDNDVQLRKHFKLK
jgi:CRISPR-associated endonuclease Cas2